MLGGLHSGRFYPFITIEGLTWRLDSIREAVTRSRLFRRLGVHTLSVLPGPIFLRSESTQLDILALIRAPAFSGRSGCALDLQRSRPTREHDLRPHPGFAPPRGIEP